MLYCFHINKKTATKVGYQPDKNKKVNDGRNDWAYSYVDLMIGRPASYDLRPSYELLGETSQGLRPVQLEWNRVAYNNIYTYTYVIYVCINEITEYYCILYSFFLLCLILCCLSRVGKSTVRQIVEDTCKAIWHNLKDRYVKTPCTDQEWKDVAKG